MNRCYKIITTDSLFKSAYDIDDVSDIKPGTRFVARFPVIEGLYIQHKTPVPHFPDNAFDAMLWHDVLKSGLPKQAYAYEIFPVTPVIKQKCHDSQGIYQCGANIIEFGPKIPMHQMRRMALQEFRRHWLKKLIQYHKISVLISVCNWRLLIRN